VGRGINASFSSGFFIEKVDELKYFKPTTNNQQPTTNNQQPTTDNQQPTTNNRQPTTENTSTALLISSF